MTAATSPVPPASDPLVESGERIIFSIRPDPAFIFLAPMWPLVGVGCAGVAASWASGRWPETVGRWVTPTGSALVAGGFMLAIVAWFAVDRAVRRYVLTDRRILRVRGIFRRSVIDLPLRRVQHSVVNRLVRERVTGLGTLGFASAGTGWIEVRWDMVARPVQVLKDVRSAVEAAAAERVG